MTLARETCVACRRDSPRVTEQEIAELSPQITDWELTAVDDVPRLERSFKFRDFAKAIAFAITVGDAAEAEGHHPRLTVEWGRVGVECRGRGREPTSAPASSAAQASLPGTATQFTVCPTRLVPDPIAPPERTCDAWGN